MRPRTFTTLDELPLVGGKLCLDFVNTTGNRTGAQPRERLNRFQDLITFGCRTGIIGKSESRELSSTQIPSDCSSIQVLQNLVEFRELLYRLFLAVLNQDPPARPDIDEFNAVLTRSMADRRLGCVDNKPQWIWPKWTPDLKGLTCRLAISASTLLTSSDLELLRKCGECDWLFLDQTKNHSRLWCKKACGDRVKARRYYAKRIAQV